VQTTIRITTESLENTWGHLTRPGPGDGAVAVFQGVVRNQEGDQPIAALEYQAYQPMAERELQRLIGDLRRRYPCSCVQVHHRIGLVPVGETSILVHVTAPHRQEAFAFLIEFMNRLKQDVPIWKVAGTPRS
jgi:molybdopterin synthase catalytic subunit